jgi:predicted GIY-YIG superfamily endonuclease
MKYIYLIQSLENSYYKIGLSKHPTKRIEELQTGNASILRLIELYTELLTDLPNLIFVFII